jgi:hypothetical protein
MRDPLETLAPLEIIEVYNAHSGRQRIAHMWEVLGERTCDCMARGALCLAMLWESAWKEGGGTKLAASRLGAVDPGELLALYNAPTFIPSSWLRDLVLEGGTGPTTERPPAPPRQPHRRPAPGGGARRSPGRRVARR